MVLNELKREGGPFTNADKIDEYMERKDLSESIKQKRMKNEVIYARDSTRSIPAAGILFRIMKKDPVTLKRKALTVVLGKISFLRCGTIEIKWTFKNYSCICYIPFLFMLNLLNNIMIKY